MTPLPLVTPDLPGIGGNLKLRPADFVVEEVPLYEPEGAGEHVYVSLTREGMTTRELVERLCKLFDIRDADLGYAGLKDKQARATQTFSIHRHKDDPGEVAKRIAEALPVEVVWARRHANKLRRGHLRGNRFRIVVDAPVDGALERAQAIAAALAVTGVPNYYGTQRFGGRGENAQKGRETLAGGGPRNPWLRSLLISAWQSFLFNQWLAERVRRGGFAELWEGDVVQKHDRGGVFVIESADTERPRFEAGEIAVTGPMFGRRMVPARGRAGELEQSILAADGATDEMFGRARLEGARRTARLILPDLRVEPCPGGLAFAFTLPRGAYATTVLREFRKEEAALPEVEDAP